MLLGGAASAGWDSFVSPAGPWRETWIGADVGLASWSIYSGLTVAPLATLEESGLRLRTAGGYGQYRYRHNEWTGSALETVRYRGAVAFTDVLAGYTLRLAPLTITGFAGVTALSRWTMPLDPDDPGGFAYGPKLALETWLDLGALSWASLDLAWTSAEQDYAVRMRGGYRLQPALSLGLEGAASGHGGYRAARAGAFVRYETGNSEVSAGAGACGDEDGRLAPYVSVNALTRY